MESSRPVTIWLDSMEIDDRCQTLIEYVQSEFGIVIDSAMIVSDAIRRWRPDTTHFGSETLGHIHSAYAMSTMLPLYDNDHFITHLEAISTGIDEVMDELEPALYGVMAELERTLPPGAPFNGSVYIPMPGYLAVVVD